MVKYTVSFILPAKNKQKKTYYCINTVIYNNLLKLNLCFPRAEDSTWLPKAVLNYLTAFYISSHGLCCPSPPCCDKKASTGKRKIQIQRLDSIFVFDIEMTQISKAELE